MLQIIATTDSEFSGTLHFVWLDANDRIATRTASVTGAASGDNLTMTVRPDGAHHSSNMSLSATRNHGAINLTWVIDNQVSSSALRRGNARDFSRHVAELQQTAQAIQTEREQQRRQDQMRRAEEDRRARIASLATELEQAAARHVASVSRVEQTQNQFIEATERMNQWFLQQQSAPALSSTRGQLLYQIQSLHWSMQALERDYLEAIDDFEVRSRRLTAGIAEHQTYCERSSEATCVRLIEVAQRYRQASSRLRSQLPHATQTIAAERARHEQILARLN